MWSVGFTAQRRDGTLTELEPRCSCDDRIAEEEDSASFCYGLLRGLVGRQHLDLAASLKSSSELTLEVGGLSESSDEQNMLDIRALDLRADGGEDAVDRGSERARYLGVGEGESSTGDADVLRGKDWSAASLGQRTKRTHRIVVLGEAEGDEVLVSLAVKVDLDLGVENFDHLHEVLGSVEGRIAELSGDDLLGSASNEDTSGLGAVRGLGFAKDELGRDRVGRVHADIDGRAACAPAISEDNGEFIPARTNLHRQHRTTAQA